MFRATRIPHIDRQRAIPWGRCVVFGAGEGFWAPFSKGVARSVLYKQCALYKQRLFCKVFRSADFRVKASVALQAFSRGWLNALRV